MKIFPLLFMAALELGASAPGVGTTAANFLKLGSSARPAAMGEAYVALADDSGGMFYNPAGLLGLNQNEIQATHTSWFGGVIMEQLTYVSAFSTSQAMGFSFGYVGLPSQVATEAVAQTADPMQNFKDVGRLNPYDMKGSVAYGRLLGGNWRLGGMLNVTAQDFADKTAVGLGLDLGALCDTPVQGLEAGLAFQNLGVAVPLVKETFSLPLLARLGLLYRLPAGALITAEAGLPNDNNFIAAVGLEANYDGLVFARAGYRYDSIFNPFSAGIGLRMDQAVLDLVWVPAGELGHTFRGSLGYRWGGWVSHEKAVELGLSQSLVSPLVDSQGGVELQPRVREPRQVKDWALFIYGPARNVVKQFKGLGAFGPSVAWDLKSDQGAPVADGTYQAILSVRLRSGKMLYSDYQKIQVNPPLPEIGLEIDPNSLDPRQQDTLFVPTDFKIRDGASPLPVRWRVDMQAQGQPIFGSVEGELGKDKGFQWQGTNEKGESFVSNSVYYFRISLLDKDGKVLKSSVPFAKRCVFRQ